MTRQSVVVAMFPFPIIKLQCRCPDAAPTRQLVAILSALCLFSFL